MRKKPYDAEIEPHVLEALRAAEPPARPKKIAPPQAPVESLQGVAWNIKPVKPAKPSKRKEPPPHYDGGDDGEAA